MFPEIVTTDDKISSISEDVLGFKLLNISSSSLSCRRHYSRTLSAVMTQFFESFKLFGIEDASFGPISVKKILNSRSSRQKVFCRKAVLRPATLLKKRLWHRCFLGNFAKFLRTSFLQNTSERLLLVMFL